MLDTLLVMPVQIVSRCVTSHFYTDFKRILDHYPACRNANHHFPILTREERYPATDIILDTQAKHTSRASVRVSLVAKAKTRWRVGGAHVTRRPLAGALHISGCRNTPVE
jgi:hypothetical protein